jgi:hypothetical protein
VLISTRLVGATDNGLSIAIKYLRCTTSSTAGNDLGATIKFLRKRRREQRPGKQDQVPATNNDRHRGQRPGHHDQVPAGRRTTSGAAGNGLCATIKYLRGFARIGLGTTAKYLQRTTSGAVDNVMGPTIDNPQRTTRAVAWVPRSITCNKQRAAVWCRPGLL